MKLADLPTKIAANIAVGDQGCWRWTGKLMHRGYGMAYDARVKKTRRAHRVVFELLRSPIPDGLQLDHLCRVRACVNPDHLEPVTGRVNSLRGEGFPGVNSRKTHCVNGHLFDLANTITRPDRPGRRECRECQREYKRRRREMTSGRAT